MSDGTIQIVHDLVQTLHEGQEGFVNAAAGVKSSALKTRILGFAAEFRSLADDLATFASANPEWPNPNLKPHRRWLDLKKAMTLCDDDAIILECRHKSKDALTEFTEALQRPLPIEVRAALLSISSRIKGLHTQMISLRREPLMQSHST
jgi:uncharacterized protein (TIGR02284 family)